ncbi:MAG: hypothetical protein DHS20C12_19320 [Pseudohongiella sp.]|nr:MAG: hypothetical protein DHS20C12_19320 [Pseudohongiella sp.]
MQRLKSQIVLVLVGVTVLAAVLLSLWGDDERGSATESMATSMATSAIVPSIEEGAASPSPSSRRAGVASPQSASLEPTSERLQSLGTTLNANAVESLRLETDIRFEEFLEGLSGSGQRIAEIQQQIVDAYADILAFGVALQEGSIGPAEAEARADPNYVVNQLAQLLTSEELTELESFLEEDAREQFLSVYSPQIEVMGVDLNGDNKEILLETLFLETYLQVNRNGLGAASDLESSLQRQLQALESARDNLRASLSADQFEAANIFLREQEQGLLGAQTIFSTN